ncbi:MAG TPA: MFS transporter [Polyangiaceae bacterium]|jgi:EmrB/QacA subfamily drug resistance transporter|nr:MAG: Multidrug resistance protein stp [Deltaproteobacteria bacterium ADurb.Bin207]HNS98357.1 MFS transporter [Polyangiaceae bacterium]HNZ25041.1 MFS transporter [Polyangiaceae bacterium]HOD25653.1 MFS transporter [Polyangiaceae bacterium]HOE51285.1 MFS transporter [Polyangiaceae bacterium]
MTETQLKRSVLWVTIFASFLTPFMGSAVNLALPAISEDFHLNAVSLNWVISSYMLTTSIFLLPAGRAGDILGRRKVFSIGVMIFTLSMVALTLSTHFAWLIGARIVQGIGGAMMFGTNMAILTSVFPPGERGKAMGINVTAVYTGLASGPFLGGVLTRYLGWRSIFAVLVPLGIVSWILLQTKVKQEWAEAKGERFDWLGAILYGLSIASLMYGVSVIFTIQGKVLIAVGAVLVPLFLWREKKASYPLFDMSLLSHNRVFAFSSMAALIHYAATSAVAFFLSLYLQYMKGLGARDAGFVLMASPIMMALLSSSAGKLSDRYNPGVLASLGMGLTSMGLVVLAFISERTSVALIVGTLAIMGIGFALFSSPNSNAIMSSVEKRQLGNASGMLGTMRNVGQTSSMAIALLLLALYMGRESIQPSNYALFMNSMKTGFVIFLVLCILGVMASLARNKSLQK